MSARPTLPDHTDVVIIGAGVMGASVAYFLSTSSDLDVTIVEKSNVAAGSTGDSSAILRHDYGDQRIYSELAVWSHDFFRDFEELTGQPLAHVTTDRVRFGKNGTEEGEYIRAGYETLKRLGVPVTLHDQDELETLFPMFDNLDRFDFAFRDPTAAYSDATDATNGFIRSATDHGAVLVTGTEVTGFDVKNQAIVGVKTDEGTVQCDTVVVAAGPWTPRLGGQLDLEIPIIPTREDIFILDPPEEFTQNYLGDLPMVRLPGGDWYLRPDFGGGVLIGTHPFADDPSDPDNYRQQPTEDMVLNVVTLLSENVSGLVDADMTSQYSGLYSTTPDHDFIIDHIGPSGCYFVCGFSGHGFKHAPAVGKATRDLIVDGKTDLCDIDYFSFTRFLDNETGRGRPVEPL